MPSDSNSLHQFLINADSLSDAAYSDYIRALPNPLEKLPEGLNSSKHRILIIEHKITFTKENFDALVDSKDLQVLFVATNINTYLTSPNIFLVDDEFREELLRLDIENVAKLGIVELMDLELLVDLPERSALIGPIINSTDDKISKLNGRSAQSLIMSSRPIATQISLFNKYQSLFSKEEVRHILANLPRPFSDIKSGYATPRLENSSENRTLAQWLDSRGIISSWKDDRFSPNEIRLNLYRSL